MFHFQGFFESSLKDTSKYSKFWFDLGCFDVLLAFSELEGVLTREIGQLSGGELQRFAIGLCCVQQADVYMFDEPSSYLDVKQRLKAAATIRDMVTASTLVFFFKNFNNGCF